MMRVNIDQSRGVLIIHLKNYSPVARDIDAALMLPITGQVMIIQQRVMRVLTKETDSFVECSSYFRREFIGFL